MPPRASLKFRAIAFASRFMVAPVAVVGPAKARADLLKASPGPAVLFGKRPAAIISRNVCINSRK